LVKVNNRAIAQAKKAGADFIDKQFVKRYDFTAVLKKPAAVKEAINDIKCISPGYFFHKGIPYIIFFTIPI
jgi:hypothetical protein